MAKDKRKGRAVQLKHALKEFMEGVVKKAQEREVSESERQALKNIERILSGIV